MDATDNKLIKLLEENAWQRREALAKVLHVSSATIRRRLRRLIQKGVIRAVAITDSGTGALPLTTIIALNIAHQDIDYVTRKLAGLTEVKWFATTTGQFDAIFLAQFHSTGDLYEFIRGKVTPIEGIKDSETFICLNIEKGRHFASID
ncbi:Lrp/AsnC family transcriptional regulator [Chloroflexota bacterium]